MARFDKAISLIEQERYRLIGKLAEEYIEQDLPVRLAVKDRQAQDLNAAIEILRRYQGDKRGRDRKCHNCGRSGMYYEEDQHSYRCICGERILKSLINETPTPKTE